MHETFGQTFFPFKTHSSYREVGHNLPQIPNKSQHQRLQPRRVVRVRYLVSCDVLLIGTPTYT